MKFPIYDFVIYEMSIYKLSFHEMTHLCQIPFLSQE